MKIQQKLSTTTLRSVLIGASCRFNNCKIIIVNILWVLVFYFKNLLSKVSDLKPPFSWNPQPHQILFPLSSFSAKFLRSQNELKQCVLGSVVNKFGDFGGWARMNVSPPVSWSRIRKMLKVIAEFGLLNAAVSKMCAVLDVGQKEDLTFWGQLENSFKES